MAKKTAVCLLVATSIGGNAYPAGSIVNVTAELAAALKLAGYATDEPAQIDYSASQGVKAEDAADVALAETLVAQAAADAAAPTELVATGIPPA